MLREVTKGKKITPATYKKTQELAAKYKVTLINKKSQRISHLALANIEAGKLKISQDANTANYEVLTLPLADYNRVEGTNYHLKNNELLVYATDKKVKLKQLQIKGKNYRIRMLSEYKYRLGDVATLTGLYLIAPDAKRAQSLLNISLNETYSFDLKGTDQAKKNYSQAASQQLRGRNSENLVTTKVEVSEIMNQFYGGMLFVGLMLSVTMLLTTGMIIYYKQVSEGYADRARFKTMQQVGLSLAETKQAINSQVLMVFMFPIVVAAIHLCFALPALASVLKLFSMYDLKLLLIVAVTMLAILIIIYLLIYSLTTKVYRRIVNAD